MLDTGHMLCARALAARVMVASVSGESRVAAALQDVVSRVHDAAQKAGHPPAVRLSCMELFASFASSFVLHSLN